MVLKLEYQAGSVERTVSLSGPDFYAETIPNLRSGSWKYKQSGQLLSSRSRESNTQTINVKAVDKGKLDELLDLLDADVTNSKPGTLIATADNGEKWQAVVYIVKDAAQTVKVEYGETQLTVLIVEGVWRKRTDYQYVMAEIQGDGLDLPTDFLFDFSRSDISSRIGNETFTELPMDLTIYGPVSNPRIVIAGNTYAVDVTVADGERIEVDSLHCYVQLVKADGTRVSVLSKAHFEQDMNILEPLPRFGGTVTWNNMFSFDVHVWQERGRAPWA